MISYFSDLDIFPIALILAGALLIAAVFIIDHYRKNRRKSGQPKAPVTEREETEKPPSDKSSRLAESYTAAGATGQLYRPSLRTIEGGPSAFIDLLRVLLIPLSLIVAAGFILILLPQSTTERLIEELQFRSDASGAEKIAFLYLGHQLKDSEFKIQGVVRNITTDPVEELDAVVRLYSADGDLVETAIVRMDKEILEPDEIARFELVYPGYRSEFSSYSVEFKLRRGELVPYKDMRQQPDGDLQ